MNLIFCYENKFLLEFTILAESFLESNQRNLSVDYVKLQKLVRKKFSFIPKSFRVYLQLIKRKINVTLRK